MTAHAELSPTLQLACDLIRRPSVTPVDADCQKLTTHGRHEGPVLCFAGHTDVVPTGPLQAWQNDPFDALIDEHGMLCGRGAADMKGSLAAMLVATERFVADYPDHKGKVAFLITSDEEGPAHHGTKAVVERLAARKERPPLPSPSWPPSTGTTAMPSSHRPASRSPTSTPAPARPT